MDLTALNRKAAQVSRRQKHRHLETISLTASNLQEGEQTRDILCPSCGGGLSKELSFSIRKSQGSVWYKCWRASCGLKGGLQATGSLQEVPQSVPIGERHLRAQRPFDGVERPVPPGGLKFFNDHYGLFDGDLEEGEVRYVPSLDRYAFPVHSPTWNRRGVSLRTFNEAKSPKWDHYCNLNYEPWIGWYIRPYITHQNGPVVVVEDPISGIKVSRQYMTCVLNGTELNFEELSEILRVARNSHAIFALDPDATAKAIALVDKYKFFLGAKGIAVPLEKDPKYLSDKDIRELFQPYVKDK